MNPDEPTIVDATLPTHGHSPILESFRVLSALADAGIPEAVRAFQELLHREFFAPPEADRRLEYVTPANKAAMQKMLSDGPRGQFITLPAEAVTVAGNMVYAKTEETT